MRILFDHGTPRPLRGHFPEHRIDTAAEKGWSQLGNGELLEHAERDEYDLMVTTDQNMLDDGSGVRAGLRAVERDMKLYDAERVAMAGGRP